MERFLRDHRLFLHLANDASRRYSKSSVFVISFHPLFSANRRRILASSRVNREMNQVNSRSWEFDRSLSRLESTFRVNWGNMANIAKDGQ